MVILKANLKDGSKIITKKGDTGIVNFENGTLDMTNSSPYGKPFYEIRLSNYSLAMGYTSNDTHDVVDVLDDNTNKTDSCLSSVKVDWASLHVSPQYLVTDLSARVKPVKRKLLDEAIDIFNRWNDIYTIAEKGSFRYANMMCMIKDIVDLCGGNDKGKD